MQLSISAFFLALLPILAQSAGGLATVWAILVDVDMPCSLTQLFRGFDPKFLIVVPSQSEFYYDIWAVTSTAGDISESLSIPWNKHRYITSWNYLHLMSVLIAATAASGLASLTMPWFEAIVEKKSCRQHRFTITVRDYRAPGIWWRLKRPCVSLEQSYGEALIPPPFDMSTGRVDMESYDGYFQKSGPRIPVYWPDKKNKTLDELRSMKLPQRLNSKQKTAIRARFEEIYDDEWGAGQWLSHYEMKVFSIDESAMQ